MKYSLRRACRIVRLSPALVTSLIAAGVVTPARGARGAFEFSFADLAVLRELSSAGSRLLSRGVRRLTPAPGRRFVVRAGRPVIVDHDGSAWDVVSGQRLIDFDAAAAPSARVLVLRDDGADRAQLLYEALALEQSDAEAAIDVYRRVIAATPQCEEAYLNLSALLQESGRVGQALDVLDEGLGQVPDSALLNFNRGVALQSSGQFAAAAIAYQQALAGDPQLADAHANLALVWLELGDDRQAIRHYNTMRRLQR